MGAGSGLEHYFPRLPGANGSGSSSSAGTGSSITSSANDVEKMKRALHSVCPAQRKRKFVQPHSGLHKRSNPAVKLLTPSPNVQEAIGNGDQERAVGAIDISTPGSFIEISTTADTIMVDSGGEEGDDADDDDDFQREPSRKLTSKTYDSRRKFQLSWMARCPWAEAIEVSGVTMVKCTTCSVAIGKPTILALKIATLQRHQGNYTAEKNMPGGIRKGDKYVAANCRHLKNERTVASRGVRPIDEVIQDMVGEKAQKKQQMGVIFHLLSSGRPMVDFAAI